MQLFHRHFGVGQDLIILHGVFGLSDNWVSIGKKIAEKFSVHILDQRNHGRSPHSPVFNYYSMVDDLLEFIDEHNIVNPVIIGHSMGGKVAMRFALENPDIVDKLIVIDISTRKYNHHDHHGKLIKAMKSVDFSQVNNRIKIEEQLAEHISSKPIRLFLMKNIDRLDKNKFGWKINLDAICENIDELFEGINTGEQFHKPSLFVRGGKSPYITDEDYDGIYRHFPAAQIQTIENATHWVHADTPDELCRMLSVFLDKYCAYKP